MGRQERRRIISTAELISRHKYSLWGKFALRASVVSIAIAVAALLFRDLDLAPGLSYLDVAILSGSPEGQYHAIVERLAQAGKRQDGRIDNIVSQGSRDNLEQLIAAKKGCSVQLGLVQDGFDPTLMQGLELIGRVGRRESIILLGRKGDQIHRLKDMKGMRIGVGPDRSGSAYLAHRVLDMPEFATLNIIQERHPLTEQVKLAANGDLDLALFVIDEDSALIAQAVRDQHLQIVGLEHAEALARRFPFAHYGTLTAGQYDPVRVLPPVAKPVLRLDTLLLGNGCATHSQIVGLMTLLSRTYPDFIERNRTLQPPAGLKLSESARGFYDNQGAEFADEHVPWLVDIMPPSNWVYTLMVVSLFFNLAGFVNNQRLALIDLKRVALENDIAVLFGRRLSNEEIRHFDPESEKHPIDRHELERIIEGYRRHLEKCRHQSLSVLSPMGEEMGYRDQEIIMTATLDVMRDLRARLFAV